MTDPYDHEAERAILGALLAQPSLLASMPLDLEHFHPRHQPILVALRAAVAAHGDEVESTQVVRELMARDKLTAVGGGPYIAECIEFRAMASNVRYYCEAVEAATMRRRLRQVGTRLVQMADSASDTSGLLDAVSSQYTELAGLLDTGVSSEPPIHGLSAVGDFVTEDQEPYRWVIPGILEHQDRCVITAGEGVGKSVLSRQLALATAAGRHPFLPRYHIPPKRTLMVDLENPPSLIRRNLHHQVGRLTAHGVQDEGRAWIWREPDGIDVRTTLGYRKLERVMEQTQPDLVCIGPVYKMSLAHGDKYEVEAQEVQQAVDRLRHKYGCAFFMEHHSAKGMAGADRTGDPFGSSFWMRWPEFGLALKHDRDAEENVFTVGRFRRDRDERYWPNQLVKNAHPLVPWAPMWDDLEHEHLLVGMCTELAR